MVSERRVVASEPGVIDYALERVLAGYRGYLIFERGLSERTVALYQPRARLFLSQREEFPELGLDRLTAADVTGFLASKSPRSVVPRRRCWWRLSDRCCAICMSPGWSPRRLSGRCLR